MSRPTALLVLCLALVLSAPARSQLTTLGSLQLFECLTLGDCGADDRFGQAVAAGDFNDDGFDDLAVGVPSETVNGHAAAGSLHVYYGSPGGLELSGDAIFDQSTSGIAGSPEDGDVFGEALAAGDFDGDGIEDLAIGVPYEDDGDIADAGAVQILFGSANGLTTSGSRYYTQDSLPSPESAEQNDRFGSSLVAGDQHGSGFAQLAIGVPGETQGLLDVDSGVVEVLGSSAGVPLTAMDEVQQDVSCEGNPFEREGFDSFGDAVGFRARASGGEWVVGNPNEDFSGKSDAGTVIFDGTEGCMSQNSTSVLDAAEDNDRFGSAIAAGDFNGDGRQDVAVGIRGETLESTGEQGAGAVSVLYADSSDTVTGSGDALFTQDAFQPSESAETLDHFGSSLATGDFDGDGVADLAVGAPDDGEDGHGLAGAVGILYGRSGGGLAANGTQQTFDEGFPSGMPGAPPQSNGQFGTALAAGDFDGNGVADLAIGAPGETAVSTHDGTLTVLYGMDRSIGAFGTVAFTSATITVPEPTTSTGHIALLTRDRSAVVGASVDYARTGGTATAGTDFTLNPGTKSWTPGSMSPKPISFQVLPDTRDEPDETIVVTLSNPTDGTALGTPSTLTITITDDDVAGSLRFHQSAYTARESDGFVDVEVDREGGAASGVSVHFATADGTATAGADYTATSTTFIFGADQTALHVSVPILQDATLEPNETVTLQLSAPGGGGSLGTPATATLTIVDDELLVDGFESGTLARWAAHTP